LHICSNKLPYKYITIKEKLYVVSSIIHQQINKFGVNVDFTSTIRQKNVLFSFQEPAAPKEGMGGKAGL